MSKFKHAAPQGKSILGALQATEMIDSKPALPAGMSSGCLLSLPAGHLS